MPKTTADRPTTAKRGRVVQIFQQMNLDREDRLIGVRKATSLKQALLDYYEETLKPQGWQKPLVNGNVLTVSATKPRRTCTFKAKDVS